jgi:hypothetical protein
MLGAEDVAFPKLNLLSFYLYGAVQPLGRGVDGMAIALAASA